MKSLTPVLNKAKRRLESFDLKGKMSRRKPWVLFIRNPRVPMSKISPQPSGIQGLLKLAGRNFDSWGPELLSVFEQRRLVTREGAWSIDRVTQTIEAGKISLVFHRAQVWNPDFLRFARFCSDRASREFSANLYYTPAGQQTLGRHRDTHDVIVLQLEGYKTWRLVSPSGRSPRIEIELHPGDILYIPKGYPHEARASKHYSSTHLTIGLHPKLSQNTNRISLTRDLTLELLSTDFWIRSEDYTTAVYFRDKCFVLPRPKSIRQGDLLGLLQQSSRDPIGMKAIEAMAENHLVAFRHG